MTSTRKYLPSVLAIDAVSEDFEPALGPMRVGRAVATAGRQLYSVIALVDTGSASSPAYLCVGVHIAKRVPEPKLLPPPLDPDRLASHRVRDPDPGVRTLFKVLSDVWIDRTQFVSSLSTIFLDEAYQSIVGLGPSVLPFILERLPEEPERWLWALRVVTREDPVPPDASPDEAVEAWHRWGREHRYLR